LSLTEQSFILSAVDLFVAHRPESRECWVALSNFYFPGRSGLTNVFAYFKGDIIRCRDFLSSHRCGHIGFKQGKQGKQGNTRSTPTLASVFGPLSEAAMQRNAPHPSQADHQSSGDESDRYSAGGDGMPMSPPDNPPSPHGGHSSDAGDCLDDDDDESFYHEVDEVEQLFFQAAVRFVENSVDLLGTAASILTEYSKALQSSEISSMIDGHILACDFLEKRIDKVHFVLPLMESPVKVRKLFVHVTWDSFDRQLCLCDCASFEMQSPDPVTLQRKFCVHLLFVELLCDLKTRFFARFLQLCSRVDGLFASYETALASAQSPELAAEVAMHAYVSNPKNFLLGPLTLSVTSEVYSVLARNSDVDQPEFISFLTTKQGLSFINCRSRFCNRKSLKISPEHRGVDIGTLGDEILCLHVRCFRSTIPRDHFQTTLQRMVSAVAQLPKTEVNFDKETGLYTYQSLSRDIVRKSQLHGINIPDLHCPDSQFWKEFRKIHHLLLAYAGAYRGSEESQMHKVIYVPNNAEEVTTFCSPRTAHCFCEGRFAWREQCVPSHRILLYTLLGPFSIPVWKFVSQSCTCELDYFGLHHGVFVHSAAVALTCDLIVDFQTDGFSRGFDFTAFCQKTTKSYQIMYGSDIKSFLCKTTFGSCFWEFWCCLGNVGEDGAWRQLDFREQCQGCVSQPGYDPSTPLPAIAMDATKRTTLSFKFDSPITSARESGTAFKPRTSRRYSRTVCVQPLDNVGAKLFNEGVSGISSCLSYASGVADKTRHKIENWSEISPQSLSVLPKPLVDLAHLVFCELHSVKEVDAKKKHPLSCLAMLLLESLKDQSVIDILPYELKEDLRYVVDQPEAILVQDDARASRSFRTVRERSRLFGPVLILVCKEITTQARAHFHTPLLTFTLAFLSFLLHRRNEVWIELSADQSSEFIPIPASYNPPENGCAFYYSTSGLKGRQCRPVADLDEKGRKGSNFDDDPAESCQKIFLQPSGGSYVMFVFCPLHGHCWGFSLIDGAEGRKDVHSALFPYLEVAPKVIFYDFACRYFSSLCSFTHRSASEYCLNREGDYYKKSHFYHDVTP